MDFMDLYLVVGFLDQNFDAFAEYLEDECMIENTEAGVIIEKIKTEAEKLRWNETLRGNHAERHRHQEEPIRQA